RPAPSSATSSLALSPSSSPPHAAAPTPRITTAASAAALRIRNIRSPVHLHRYVPVPERATLPEAPAPAAHRRRDAAPAAADRSRRRLRALSALGSRLAVRADPGVDVLGGLRAC